jgi:hypothetical protein
MSIFHLPYTFPHDEILESGILLLVYALAGSFFLAVRGLHNRSLSCLRTYTLMSCSTTTSKVTSRQRISHVSHIADTHSTELVKL